MFILLVLLLMERRIIESERPLSSPLESVPIRRIFLTFEELIKELPELILSPSSTIFTLLIRVITIIEYKINKIRNKPIIDIKIFVRHPPRLFVFLTFTAFCRWALLARTC